MIPINFGYSTKNIPVPSNDNFLFILVQRIEIFIKRMRWKAHFFLQDTIHSINDRNQSYYILKTKKGPALVDELMDFETD